MATHCVKRVLKIDDSLDVFPVHGVGGILGTLLTGVFVSASLGGSGLIPDRSMAYQVYVQALAVLATAAWSGGVTFILFKLLGATVGVRVTTEQEMEGLDLAEHGERAYII